MFGNKLDQAIHKRPVHEFTGTPAQRARPQRRPTGAPPPLPHPITMANGPWTGPVDCGHGEGIGILESFSALG